MMIDVPLLIISKSVHICMDEHHNEGIEQVKQQPHIHHLHVGGLRQVVAHIDEHSSQHQHGGQVHSDDSFKEKGFEKVCRISDDVEENCWEEYGQEGAKESS